MGTTLLTLTDMCKSYPGVRALDNVSLSVEAGQVHALVGENGAGKSTLIKMISGYESPDSGSIEINGQSYASLSPQQALEAGVATIYQDTMLVAELSVAENIFLGRFPKRARLLDRKAMNEQAQAVLENLGVNIPATKQVAALGASEAQYVAIAKAVAGEANIIIMDEPTASLTDEDSEKLFALVRRLREGGKAVIYISHRLGEIMDLADCITVMRDGRVVESTRPHDVTRDELVRMIVGREIGKIYPARTATPGSVVLRVQNLQGKLVKDMSFDLHQGEILGVAGLVGSGITELGQLLFGATKCYGGSIATPGAELSLTSPEDAAHAGIGYVPADRKSQGVLLGQSVKDNISLASLEKISRALFIDTKREAHMADEFIEGLQIKTPSRDQLVSNLSGGNQQKVALSKWLASEAQILIFDEPTQGVDVGARQEIYRLMNKLTEQGISIIVLSSDTEELVGIADRIIVMRDGVVATTLEGRSSFKQETVIAFASGAAA